MKKFIFIVSIIVMFVLAIPAYAQNGDAPQSELVRLIEQIGVVGASLIAGFTSTLASALTNWIRNWSFLTEEDKKKITGLGADLLNIISSLLVSLLMIGVSYAIGLVENLSLQDLLQMVTVLTGMTAGGSSLVVHKLNKALHK